MFKTTVLRSARGLRPVVSPQRMMIPQLLTIPVGKIGGVRFNSTATSSEITNELGKFSEEVALTMTSDQIGYLDSIGMAQGYGPTALIEHLLEYTHVYTGLPWWGSIITATIAIRVIMFPLYVKASANAAKMAKVKPELDEIMTGLKEAETHQERVEYGMARKELMKKHDIHMSHQFFPILQMPIAYGFFQALRKMANFPVEGFSSQGAAWFQDLAQVDPYLGLQIISGLVVTGMFRLGGETGAAQINPAMKQFMYAIPVLSLFITKNFSAAVVLYFAANSVFSLLQTLIFRSRICRRLLKIPAIVVKPKSGPGAAAQSQNIGEWWKDFNKRNKESTQKKMQESNKKLGVMQKRRRDVDRNFVKRH